MVLLTMTPVILEALEQVRSANLLTEEVTKKSVAEELANGDRKSAEQGAPVDSGQNVEVPEQKRSLESSAVTTSEENRPIALRQEPTLLNPKLGNPISHTQVIELWETTKKLDISTYSLDALLRGSKIYIAPPASKPEPTSEYKALMARLRREEEERCYQRMINPPPPMETFAQRFSHSSAAHAFASAQQTIDTEDEVSYEDIKRQMGLIINVLVSIICCSIALWKVARWWGTPQRLALSMGGSILVGVAEVVIYMGYIRRVGESKSRENAVGEVKEIMRTWVVGGKEDQNEEVVSLDGKDASDTQPRRRKKEMGYCS